MDSYKFIKLCKNTKKPIQGAFFKYPKQLNEIDPNRYNIGLLAGASDLLILDIDEKNDGIKEYNEYLKTNEPPNTMTQKTPNNGLHLIFKATSKNYTDEQRELINKLKNKAGYRGKGLDVRKNSGYIVFSPSTIDGKKYKIINDTKPQKIPLTILKWLLEFENIKTDAINSNIILIKDIEQIKDILGKLKNVSSRQWFQITTALKNLLNEYNNIEEDEILKIWNTWSKTEEGYNKKDNLKIWQSINNNLNFNYVIALYNETASKKEQIDILDSFKPLEEMKPPEKMKILNMNSKFLYDENNNGDQMTQKIFNEYETIIIKSTTGTGKTSNISKFTAQYMKNRPELKFLSLVNLISLSKQHLSNFKNINLMSYEDKENLNKEEHNLTICLNSLMMFHGYEKEFFNNYIVYIDEITSFLNSLTHNSTLNSNLKFIVNILFKIVNNAHKVIISDAVINDNSFNFIEKRDNKIFINNEFKKYESITVFKLNDETDFLNNMLDKVEKKEYFLMASDSKETATKYFNECKSDEKELITADTKTIINDATAQFKNKFIFYSPSITTGLDFTIDTAQDVLIYINGKTITPESSFQQMTRTRNIKRVYCFINDIKSKNSTFSTLEDTKTHFKTIGETHDKLKNINYHYNDDGDAVFNDNIFFSLFSFNEYQQDTFNTNKKQHFLNILKNNGFNIEEHGQNKKLDKVKNKEMKEKIEEDKEIKFNNHIEGIKEDVNIKNTIQFLNIEDNETKILFKDIIIDEHKREDSLNLMRLFYAPEKIKIKLLQQPHNIPNYKAVFTNYTKIDLINQLEIILKIERFNFNKLEQDKEINLNEDLIKKINTSFRCTQTPKTFNDAIDYYEKKISHLIGKIELIDTTREQKNKKRVYHHKINKDTITKYLKLVELKNPTRKNLIKHSLFYEMEQQPTEDGEEIKTEFIDDENNKEEDIIEIFEDYRTSEKQAETIFNIFHKYHKNLNDNDLIKIGLSIEFIKNYREQIKKYVK